MRYEIKGDTLPVVICYLEGGEKMITEGGGMSWMSPNMKMETTTNEESARHLEECFPVSIYSRIFIPHKLARG